MAFHKLDERVLVTPGLLRRFHFEAKFDDGDGTFFAAIIKNDGHILTHGIGREPDIASRIYAFDALRLINRELHHDGAWTVIWTNPRHPAELIMNPHRTVYQRFAILWMDKDGDVQFTNDIVDSDMDVDAIFSNPTFLFDHAEFAWQEWNRLINKVVAPTEGQVYRAALGQRAPSAGRVH